MSTSTSEAHREMDNPTYRNQEKVHREGNL